MWQTIAASVFRSFLRNESDVIFFDGGAEIASTGKCKYETGHFARMENASTENASTIRKGGKRKYEFAGLEYASTENVSTPLNTICGVLLNFTK